MMNRVIKTRSLCITYLGAGTQRRIQVDFIYRDKDKCSAQNVKVQNRTCINKK